MTKRRGIAVAQMGPIARSEERASAVRRMVALLHEAHGRGADLVVFPEIALTSFFPRWYLEDPAEIDAFFEDEVPNGATKPLFEAAAQAGVAFSFGYAERVREAKGFRYFNTAVLVDRLGRIAGKYRKIHLPGHMEHEPGRPWQNLEKRYFEVGDLGFGVFGLDGMRAGMCICNDRRWPETWRVLGLKGAELVCLGYNTPLHNPPVPQHDHLTSFHHLLSLQAGAYQNGVFVAAAAKAGFEEGSMLLGQSCIVAPTGEIIAMSSTIGDEVITAACDFSICEDIRREMFNFAAHRRPEHYGIIVEGADPAQPAS